MYDREPDILLSTSFRDLPRLADGFAEVDVGRELALNRLKSALC